MPPVLIGSSYAQDFQIGTGADQTMTFPVPGGAPVAGTILIVHGTSVPAYVATGGWTGLGTSFFGAIPSVDPNVYLGLWKIADGSEGMLVDVTTSAQPADAFPHHYFSRSGAIHAFVARTVAGTPALTFQAGTPHLIVQGQDIQFTFAAQADTSDATLYLAWFSMVGDGATEGWDIVDHGNIAFDTQITQLGSGSTGTLDHIQQDTFPALYTVSGMWKVGYIPLSGTNPATSNEFTSDNIIANRTIHRSTKFGREASQGYWGVLATRL